MPEQVNEARPALAFAEWDVSKRTEYEYGKGNENMTTRIVKLDGDIEIGLLVDASAEWHGIADIAVDGIPLRDGTFPLLPRIDTPEGYRYDRAFLDKVEQDGNGAVVVKLRIVGTPGLRGEYIDNYEQTLVNVGLSREPVEDTLELVLKPLSGKLGGRQWTGFSYEFRFSSTARRIHRLTVDGSWEIGGAISRNTVLSQGQCNMPVYRGAKGNLFTTACLNRLELYGQPSGYSYQLGPRAGLLQPFDFQYAKQGVLLRYWPRFKSISSLIESPRGSTRLRVVDEHRVKLARRAATTPQNVLFTPGPISHHEARDLWWAARERVVAGIRKPYKVAPTFVVPKVLMSYKTRVTDGSVKMLVAPGVEVDTREVPYALADHVFPRMAKAGIRRFFPEPMSESDVTVVGLRRKCDNGIHGDLHCGSICATHRMLPSEFWGGMKAWRYMYDKARDHGIELGAWFSTVLSPNAAILREHPEWRMRAVNGLTWSGGYGINSIVAMDLDHPGYFDWILNDIRRWKEEGGIDYLFTDSWANLNLLAYNCDERMRTNLDALGRLYGEFQKLGIQSFSFEGVSPFGMGDFGVVDLQGARLAEIPGVVGQNDLAWWIGNEDMAVDNCLGIEPRYRTQEELEQFQFRLMANRAGAMIHRYNLEYELADWEVRLNRIYAQALPFMADARRTILPNGAGVRWDGPKGTLVWAYRDSTLRVSRRATVERLTGGKPEKTSSDRTLHMRKHAVYRLWTR